LGIGDWGLGIGANPQSPIPNPQYILILFVNLIKNVTNIYVRSYVKYVSVKKNKYKIILIIFIIHN